jgi:hypothetical protein
LDGLAIEVKPEQTADLALTVLDNQRNFAAGAHDGRIGKRCGHEELLPQHFLQTLLDFH